MKNKRKQELLSWISNSLSQEQSSLKAFNQYGDVLPEYDLEDGPSIRLDNLLGYLSTALSDAEFLLVGEAAGPWGCRFTGIPFTSEQQLIKSEVPFVGQRSSRDFSVSAGKGNGTKRSPFRSNSSDAFWEIMRSYWPRFVVWNCVPLHTHKASPHLSVRNPTDVETGKFENYICRLFNYRTFRSVVAVGAKARDRLQNLGIEAVYVRHPATGGKYKFAGGISEIFNE